VGVIPEEWTVTTLGNICEFENGDRSSNYPSSDDFALNGIPFFNAGHIDNGKIFYSNMDYITHECFSRLTRGKTKPGDILYCLRGSLGKFGLVDNTFDEGAIASSLVIARPKKSKILSDYLLCYFSSSSKMIEILAGGAAQPNLGVQDLEKFLIPIPVNLDEQNAISLALSDVDALLAKLDQLITKKRELKKATMQQLLTGHTRLPGFSGKWETKRLGDVALLKNGYTFKSKTYTDSGKYKVITIANVQDGFMRTDGCSLVDEVPGDLQLHQNLKIGDFLLSMTGNVGRVCRVVEDNCLLNQRVGKVVGQSINNDFLYATLSDVTFQNAMVDMAKGGAQPNLSASDILSYPVLIPKDQEEQRSIALIIFNLDKELTTLESRRDKAKLLKQGMMQELLTGRIRLA
jgi:type I restriction enzyme S subunit